MACLFLICFCELDYTLSSFMECIEGENRQDTKAIIVRKGDRSCEPSSKDNQEDQYNFYRNISAAALCFIDADHAYNRDQERP